MITIELSLGELSEANYIASRYCGLWTVDCGLKKTPNYQLKKNCGPSTVDYGLKTKQNYQLLTTN